MNPWLITDTYELIGVVEQIKTPATYLVDMFFPQVMPVSTSEWVSIEYRKEGRMLAPYVVPGGRGVNISRGTSKVANYKAPMVAPRRTISLHDISLRQFGEQPVYSNLTPEDRAVTMQANDLVDLRRLIQNAKNKQAAEILQTGRVLIKGYADDGRTVETLPVQYDWSGLLNAGTPWSQATASIYDDIKAASEKIQEDTGIIPTIMVCGRNVERYLLNNEEIQKWLMIPNRANLSLMSFEPRYTTAQVRFVGYISGLNLEVVTYSETYTAEDGSIQPFLDPDTVIIGIPGRGRQLYGAITLMNNAGQWETFSAREVPVYTAEPTTQQSALTIYSRFLLAPSVIEDWVAMKVI